jgi:phospholipase C
LGSTLFPGQSFDHSSVVSTMRSVFGLGGPLTNRDRDAPTWDGCLTAAARTTNLDLATQAVVANQQVSDASPAPVHIDGFASGMGLIAMDLDRVGARIIRKPTIGDFTPKSVAAFHAARQATLNSGDFPETLGKYMGAVQARAAAVKAKA